MPTGATAARVRRTLLHRLHSLITLSAPERTTALGHLEELRWRIVASVVTVVTATAVAYAWRTTLLGVLDRPLGSDAKLVTLSVTEPFMTTVAVCVYAGLAFAMPVVLFHVWRYLSPALARDQRRAARPYLVSVPLLFASGVTFGYLVVLGPAVRFLLGFGAHTFETQVRAQYYYSFASMTLLGCGLVFLMPLVLLLLARIGVVDAAILRSQRRIAIVVLLLMAALLPTADPVSLGLEALPLLVLYEGSILLIAVGERRRA